MDELTNCVIFTDKYSQYSMRSSNFYHILFAAQGESLSYCQHRYLKGELKIDI